MRSAGLDIGSRNIKLVITDHEGTIVEKRKTSTTFDPLAKCEEILADLDYEILTATGYGRHLFNEKHNVSVVSEIKAHAIGARQWDTGARAVLDIGGQDTKVIALNPKGRVIKFEMNDRCAAGTGKFLEVMAVAFNYDIHEFGIFALKGEKASQISSMCTVFAESEATSLMARGEKPENIALGLHLAVAKRAASMVRRVAGNVPILFSGGVANNTCIQKLIAQEICESVKTPEFPDFTGAYGAALLNLD